MERLTERFENGQVGTLGCGNNCKYDYKYCNNYLEDCPTITEIYEKLAAYEDAEEQGLLLRLPCKVGDNIYIIKPYGIEEASITGISEADDIDCFCFEIYIDPDCHEIIALEEFNDTWFLTKEETEAKLKEMECNHE